MNACYLYYFSTRQPCYYDFMMKLSVFYDHIREATGQNDQSLEEICNLVKSYGIDAVEMDAACYEPQEEMIK